MAIVVVHLAIAREIVVEPIVRESKEKQKEM
jgi:hypothetical protein